MEAFGDLKGKERALLFREAPNEGPLVYYAWPIVPKLSDFSVCFEEFHICFIYYLGNFCLLRHPPFSLFF